MEKALTHVTNPFLRTGVQLVIDRTPEEEIIDLLQWRIALRGVLFLCLGLLLYLYLPFREGANPVFNSGDFSSGGAMFRSIFRLDEALPINQLTVVTPFFDRLASTIAEIWRSIPLIIWGFATLGSVLLVHRNKRYAAVLGLIIVCSVFVTVYTADFSRYNLDLYTVEVLVPRMSEVVTKT